MRATFALDRNWFAKALVKALAPVVILGLLASALRPAAAEDWPTRPVTIVLGFAAGQMMDFVARAMAKDMTITLGQPVLIELRTGGGGIVANNYVAKAPADGYTLLMAPIGPVVLRPMMDKTVSFDLNTEFVPISLVGESPNVLLANPKLGLKTVRDLVAYAKANGGKISIGHSGAGTLGQLCGILFAQQADLDLASVSYRGTGPMLIDVLSGTLDAGFPAYNPATKQASVLAVTTKQRPDFLPDVPTMKESGYDIVGGVWEAIFGPANLPPEIVAKVNSAIDSFVRKPETKQLSGDFGFQVNGGPPSRLVDQIMQDRAKWAKIIADGNIKAEQ